MSLFAQPALTSDLNQLTNKYRPATVSAFRGLVDQKGNGPKRICERLIANPRACSLMFVGGSGTGKTTMALALAEQVNAELHHIPSHSCDAAAIASVVNACSHLPAPGKRMHLVLIDEADQMTKAAQIALLSRLDCTGELADTIWVFTANETAGLHDRFLSRCIKVPFSNYRMSEGATALLEEIWAAEAPAGAEPPTFARIVKESKNNVRAALMELQKELMFA